MYKTARDNLSVWYCTKIVLQSVINKVVYKVCENSFKKRVSIWRKEQLIRIFAGKSHVRIGRYNTFCKALDIDPYYLLLIKGLHRPVRVVHFISLNKAQLLKSLILLQHLPSSFQKIGWHDMNGKEWLHKQKQPTKQQTMKQ